MSHNDIKENERSGLNRRRFLECFAAFGAAAALLPNHINANAANLDENNITLETIKSAEKIIGIELTADERKRIVKGLLENLDAFNNLREKEIDYNIIPSMVFNPVPPGMTFSKQQKPVKFSAVEEKKPKNIEDAAFYSVLQLARLIRTRKVTSTQLTKMYLSRLKRYNSTLKFVINFTEELALEQAKRADEEIQAGKYRGLLHGIPYGVKDLRGVAN